MILTKPIVRALLQTNCASKDGHILLPGQMHDTACDLMSKGFLVRDVLGVFSLSDQARWLMQGKFGYHVMDK